jgi:ketosteroid isomerase-like protein
MVRSIAGGMGKGAARPRVPRATSRKEIQMKLLTSFLALAALSFSTSAFGQEESSPSVAPEEKASANIEETPAATPAEKALATPEAKATATPAESPAAQKKEKPAAAAPEKAASPAATKAGAAPSGKKMSVEATLKDNENRWEAAIAKHDTAAVELMVADDFIGVSSKNKVQNRRAMLAEMKGDKDTYTSAKVEKLDVRNYGGGVAVVVGTTREKGTSKDGKSFDKTYRYTDTWMERNGQWKCIASQVALVQR